MVRYHDTGSETSTTLLKSTVSNGKINFASNLFSTYAIAYMDTVKSGTNNDGSGNGNSDGSDVIVDNGNQPKQTGKTNKESSESKNYQSLETSEEDENVEDYDEKNILRKHDMTPDDIHDLLNSGDSGSKDQLEGLVKEAQEVGNVDNEASGEGLHAKISDDSVSDLLLDICSEEELVKILQGDQVKLNLIAKEADCDKDDARLDGIIEDGDAIYSSLDFRLDYTIGDGKQMEADLSGTEFTVTMDVPDGLQKYCRHGGTVRIVRIFKDADGNELCEYIDVEVADGRMTFVVDGDSEYVILSSGNGEAGTTAKKFVMLNFLLMLIMIAFAIVDILKKKKLWWLGTAIAIAAAILFILTTGFYGAVFADLWSIAFAVLAVISAVTLIWKKQSYED